MQVKQLSGVQNIIQQGTTNGIQLPILTVTALEVQLMHNWLYLISVIKSHNSINGKTNFTIKMEDDALKLETVVVTAMGIKRKASLTYSLSN